MWYLKHVINFLFQNFLFIKSKKNLQTIIDVIIEIIYRNINYITLKIFAKTLIKFNIQSQILQFL